MQFLNNIKLNFNQLLDFIVQQSGTVPNQGLKDGRLYFDTNSERKGLYVYDTNAFKKIGYAHNVNYPTFTANTKYYVEKIKQENGKIVPTHTAFTTFAASILQPGTTNNSTNDLQLKITPVVGSAVTVTLPAASTSAFGIVTKNDQTFGGKKIFNGNIQTSKIFFGSGDNAPYIELVNGVLHTNVGFYSDSFVSALGQNSSGTGGGGIAFTAGNGLELATAQGSEEKVLNVLLASNGGLAFDTSSPNKRIKVDTTWLNTKIGNKVESYGYATQAFVNSSIATNTATFRGTFDSASALPTTGCDANDYAFVTGTENNNSYYDRYKWTASGWVKEYRLNNSSFTSEQWSAINSGITSAGVTKLSGIASGAQVNVLEGVNLNDSALTITSKKVNVNACTSIGVPTGLTAGTLASNGKITISFSSGYSIPTTAKQTSWDSKYTLPTQGIPLTDLSDGVQESLGLADSSIQSHQTIYNLTFSAGTFSTKTFTANSEAQTVNIPTTTNHISEGDNKYYTDARAQGAAKSVCAGIKEFNITNGTVFDPTSSNGGYAFKDNKIVVSLYDGSGNMVMADVQIKSDGASTPKYGVYVKLASAATIRIVAHGLIA